MVTMDTPISGHTVTQRNTPYAITGDIAYASTVGNPRATDTKHHNFLQQGQYVSVQKAYAESDHLTQSEPDPEDMQARNSPDTNKVNAPLPKPYATQEVGSHSLGEYHDDEAKNPTESSPIFEQHSIVPGYYMRRDARVDLERPTIHEDSFIYSHRCSLISAYDELLKIREDITKYIEAKSFDDPFPKDLLGNLNTWLTTIRPMVDLVAEDAKPDLASALYCALHRPWDGIAAQAEVRSISQAYQDGLKEVEGIKAFEDAVKDAKAHGKSALSQLAGQYLQPGHTVRRQDLRPKFASKDFIKLLRNCPTECPLLNIKEWLQYHMGLRYFSPSTGRMRAGSITSKITQADVGWPNRVWDAFGIPPSGKNRSRKNKKSIDILHVCAVETPEENPEDRTDDDTNRTLDESLDEDDDEGTFDRHAQHQYFAPGTGLERASVLLKSPAFRTQYKHPFAMILAIMPLKYHTN